MNRPGIIIGSTVLVVGLIGLSIFFSVSNRQIVAEAALVPALTMSTTAMDEFSLHYPRHYDSYMRNEQTLPPAVSYGGSVSVSNLDIYPYMRTLWAGYGFAKEYNEERGHLWTIEDVNHIARVGESTSLSCFYCKSADVPRMLDQLGDAYFTTNFLATKQEFTHPITCSDCHDPTTMELRITRPAVTEAMARQGVDISKATRQEMGSLVCAQCHVEYYFDPNAGGRVTFPWDNGFDPQDSYQYYTEQGFSDWTHTISGTKMLKAQHPEFETFQGSTHQSNGLSCANCHMPLMKEGTAKLSSHWLTSPLRTVEQSCGPCHRQGADEIKQRVLYSQDKVRKHLDTSGLALQEAHTLIGEAAKNSQINAGRLEEARELVREGQWYWDYVAADNSMGFHNPQKALDTLTMAVDRAHRAQVLTKDAQLAAR